MDTELTKNIVLSIINCVYVSTTCIAGNDCLSIFYKLLSRTFYYEQLTIK